MTKCIFSCFFYFSLCCYRNTNNNKTVYLTVQYLCKHPASVGFLIHFQKPLFSIEDIRFKALQSGKQSFSLIYFKSMCIDILWNMLLVHLIDTKARKNCVLLWIWHATQIRSANFSYLFCLWYGNCTKMHLTPPDWQQKLTHVWYVTSSTQKSTVPLDWLNSRA